MQQVPAPAASGMRPTKVAPSAFLPGQLLRFAPGRSMKMLNVVGSASSDTGMSITPPGRRRFTDTDFISPCPDSAGHSGHEAELRWRFEEGGRPRTAAARSHLDYLSLPGTPWRGVCQDIDA